MKKVIIVGANGTIGSELKKQLSIYNTVIPVTKHLKFSAYQKLISNEVPDFIINAAGIVSNDLNECLEVNFYLTESIFKALSLSKIKCRVLLIGSAAEYGLIEDQNNGVKETANMNPISNYGLSKCMQSLLARKYFNQGVDIVIARVFNIQAENLNNNLFLGSLINQIKQFKSGKIKNIHLGNISTFRDYIDLSAACNKIINVLINGKSGEIYNIGSGTPVSMKTLLLAYLKKYDVDYKNIIFTPHPEGVFKIYSDNTKYNKL